MRPKLLYLGLVFLLLIGLISASSVSITKVTYPSKIAPDTDKTLEIRFTVTADINGADEAEGNVVVENLNDKNPDNSYVKVLVPFSFTGPGSKVFTAKITPWGKYEGKTINFRAKTVYSINKAVQATEDSFEEQMGVFVTSNPSGAETVTLPTPQVTPECTSNSNCAADKKCSSGKCVAVPTGNCGQVANHAWVTYACCADADCGAGKECKDHECSIKATVTPSVNNSPQQQVNNVPNTNLANTSPPDNQTMEKKGMKETLIDNWPLIGGGVCCCTTILIIGAVLIYMFVIKKKK